MVDIASIFAANAPTLSASPAGEYVCEIQSASMRSRKIRDNVVWSASFVLNVLEPVDANTPQVLADELGLQYYDIDIRRTGADTQKTLQTVQDLGGALTESHVLDVAAAVEAGDRAGLNAALTAALQLVVGKPAIVVISENSRATSERYRYQPTALRPGNAEIPF